MEKFKEELEFEVLGYKLKIRPEGDSAVTAQEIVDYVRNETNEVRTKSPNITEGQVAILTALKITKEKLEIEHEYQENINQLNLVAKDALGHVEQIDSKNS